MNKLEDKMKKILDNSKPQFTKEMLEIFEKVDSDCSCPKCGRVIYCGVSKLCSEIDCGLKQK